MGETPLIPITAFFVASANRATAISDMCVCSEYSVEREREKEKEGERV